MLLVIAWRNLWRSWRRSVIVLAAITVGLAACVLMIAWSRGMLEQMAETAISLRLSHVAVLARGYTADPDPTHSLPDDGGPLRALVAALPGAHASARLVGEGLVQSPRSALRVALVGVEPGPEAGVSSVPAAIAEGSWLPPETRRPRGRALPGLVIGRAMAERLQVGVGDKVVIHVAGEAGLGAFRVIGLYRVASSDFERSFAYVRLGDAQRLLDHPGAITEIAIDLDAPESATAVRAHLAAEAARLWPDVPVEVLLWQEREPRLATLTTMMQDTSWILYAAVFIAMAFGIANVLLMSFYERTREFGVLKALGLKGRALLALMLIESVLLTLLGTALGLALAVPAVLWLGAVGLDLATFSEGLREYGIDSRIRFRLSAADLLRPVAIGTVTALVAALWPALRAVRLRPADALRQL